LSLKNAPEGIERPGEKNYPQQQTENDTMSLTKCLEASLIISFQLSSDSEEQKNLVSYSPEVA